MQLNKWIFGFSLIALVSASPDLLAKNDGKGRHHGLDSDNDGRISREEWRGNDRSYERAVRNKDRNDRDDDNDWRWRRDRDDDDDDKDDRWSRRPTRGFGRFDINNDGVISRREWAGSRSQFRQLDDNNDNVLSRSEFRNRDDDDDDMNGHPGSSNFNRLDQNDDGRLSFNEFGRSRRRFNEVDRNDNGFISLSEFNRRRGISSFFFR